MGPLSGGRDRKQMETGMDTKRIAVFAFAGLVAVASALPAAAAVKRHSVPTPDSSMTQIMAVDDEPITAGSNLGATNSLSLYNRLFDY